MANHENQFQKCDPLKCGQPHKTWKRDPRVRAIRMECQARRQMQERVNIGKIENNER